VSAGLQRKVEMCRRIVAVAAAAVVVVKTQPPEP
jgi:hypothetical protein